jgi:Mn2+/Fe2+ NRAMP family transporter
MNKWAQLTRKWHRWLAIPMFIVVPLSAVLRLSGNGKIMKDIPAWEAVQSVLILLLALTGAYLYLFRVVNRKKRQRRAVTVASQEPVNSQ